MKISISLAVLLACVLSCEAGTDWRISFIPIDPWRAMDGQTNYVKLNGVEFCGEVLGVMPHGILVDGEWGRLGTVYYPVNGWLGSALPPEYPEFFVTNYPYQAYIGEIIPSTERLMAWNAGTFTFATQNGGTRTIPELDYGIPSGPNPVLLAAVQKQIQDVEEKRRERDLRRLKYLERDAASGDSAAQYSLGIHYLYGLGCETNQVQGIFWLLKASAQGNIEASNDLQEIESAPTNRSKR